MRAPPDTARAPAGAWGSCTKPKENEDRLQVLVTPSLGLAQPQLHRHHCDSLQRRPKTLNELIAGAEFIEMMDRRAPGFLSGRRQR